MAEKHPYSPGPGGITAAINQFRKSFPKNVNAEILKQLGIAPQNESYVINVLRFIGAIDKEGKQTDRGVAVFSHHDNMAFQKAFEELVREAYADLFSLHKEGTWNLSPDQLIAFFRNKDKTTDLVGKLQATTFRLLAGFAGHGTMPTIVAPKTLTKAKPEKTKTAKQTAKDRNPSQGGDGVIRDVGLTVRVEVNLPPAGDQETYDRIFRSIRENLLNAK